MEELRQQFIERQSAAAVIDWMDRVVLAVEKADYDAASYAMNIARIHLNALQALADRQEIKAP